MRVNDSCLGCVDPGLRSLRSRLKAVSARVRGGSHWHELDSETGPSASILSIRPLVPELRRLPSLAFQRLSSRLWHAELRALGIELGPDISLYGRPIVTQASGSTIVIGARVSMISRARDTALGVSHPVVLRTLRQDARLVIGDDCGLSGVTICAAGAVEIGERVLLGADVIVADTDFHPVDLVPRRYAPLPPPAAAGAVTIEDDVFVGTRAIVLAGSHIGSGSVIGAGSVVTGVVPPRVVAAGNPCRVLRALVVRTRSDSRCARAL